MAIDDPNLKSLFTRIKDCVLTELRRSPDEPQKAPCQSRDGWIGGWRVEKKTDIVEIEKPKLEDDKSVEEKRIDDKTIKEKSGNVDEANVLQKGGTLIEENKNNEKKSSRDRRASELDRRDDDDDDDDGIRGEIEQLPEKESSSCCGTDRSKASSIRYYIKMQNPDAPICCESIAKPTYICPPKVRKDRGKEAARRENYRLGRTATCRCGGCLSSASDVEPEKKS